MSETDFGRRTPTEEYLLGICGGGTYTRRLQGPYKQSSESDDDESSEDALSNSALGRGRGRGLESDDWTDSDDRSFIRGRGTGRGRGTRRGRYSRLGRRNSLLESTCPSSSHRRSAGGTSCRSGTCARKWSGGKRSRYRGRYSRNTVRSRPFDFDGSPDMSEEFVPERGRRRSTRRRSVSRSGSRRRYRIRRRRRKSHVCCPCVTGGTRRRKRPSRRGRRGGSRSIFSYDE